VETEQTRDIVFRCPKYCERTGVNTSRRDGENASFAKISSLKFCCDYWQVIAVRPVCKHVTIATCELLTALSREIRVNAKKKNILLLLRQGSHNVKRIEWTGSLQYTF
jgi:hypothetical protein